MGSQRPAAAASDDGGSVRTKRTGHRLDVILDREHRGNALHADLWRGLDAALDELERSTEITVVVLSGAGGTFSQGGDLQAVNDEEHPFAQGAEVRLATLDWQHAVIRRLIAAPALTIAAIEGVALGGGFDLALACDVRFAAADARLGSRYVRHGLIPDLGGLFLIQRAVSHPAAALSTLTGHLFTAPEARELGLVTAVAPPGELDALIQTWVDRMEHAKPEGVRRSKAYLAASTLSDAQVGLPHAAATQTVLSQSESFQAAVRKYGSGR